VQPAAQFRSEGLERWLGMPIMAKLRGLLQYRFFDFATFWFALFASLCQKASGLRVG